MPDDVSKVDSTSSSVSMWSAYYDVPEEDAESASQQMFNALLNRPAASATQADAEYNVDNWSENRKIDFKFSENLSSSQKSELAQFQSNYQKNKARYEKVAKQTGVPPELIAAIHWRESSGNFNTYLHNGDPLGKPTTHVPAGIYCNTWEESAIDALKKRSQSAGMSADCTDLNKIADFAEGYNGYGYRNKGKPSPYVWAGTTNYSSGKYVADGIYDPNYVDRQLGVMVMMKSIM